MIKNLEEAVYSKVSQKDGGYAIELKKVKNWQWKNLLIAPNYIKLHYTRLITIIPNCIHHTQSYQLCPVTLNYTSQTIHTNYTQLYPIIPNYTHLYRIIRVRL